MNNEQLMEQFKLLRRAKKLEEMGNTDRALDLYLELHERYDPNTSDAYERPAILLERKKNYQQALEICEKAIQEIEADRMSGTKEKFQKRIDAIHEKLKDEPIEVKAVTAYQFHIIGFRSGNIQKKILATVFYGLFAVFGFLMKSIYPTLLLIGLLYAFTYFIDLIKVRDKKYRTIIAVLLLIAIGLTTFAGINLPEAINRVIELQDSEGQLPGGSEIFDADEDELPEITDTHIQEAIDLIASELEVEEAVIIVNGDVVTFGLKLTPGTDKVKAESLSESFIEILAHRVSQDEGIKAPDFTSHGELYDFYDLIASAGINTNEILAKGKKSKGSKFITWID